jgi:hypothetical protein
MATACSTTATRGLGGRGGPPARITLAAQPSERMS